MKIILHVDKTSDMMHAMRTVDHLLEAGPDQKDMIVAFSDPITNEEKSVFYAKKTKSGISVWKQGS